MSGGGQGIQGVTNIDDARAARVSRSTASSANDTKVGDLANPDQETQGNGMNERLAKLEGSYDALKVVRPMTITVLGVLLAALIFVLSFMASEIRDLAFEQKATNAKVDAIPAKLAEEFRAMRAETAAQTSAIVNSITAARQFQPQVVVVPAPSMPERLDQSIKPIPKGQP